MQEQKQAKLLSSTENEVTDSAVVVRSNGGPQCVPLNV